MSYAGEALQPAGQILGLPCQNLPDHQVTSVVDHPHHFDADSTYHPDEDPDSDFYLMRIQMRIRLRIFI
jgi:hypothetical protein